jgi:hypothetical protein
MQHLLNTPQTKNLVAVTLVAASAVAGFAYSFGLIHRAMAPYSIIDLEFAGTAQRLNEMTGAWGEAGNRAAQLSLWVDYAFMPAYAVLFAGLTLLAARAAAGRWQTLGLWLAPAPFAAWACDALENALLLAALPPAMPSDAMLTGAAVAAALKFGLLLTGAIYVIAAGGLALARRLTGAQAAR